MTDPIMTQRETAQYIAQQLHVSERQVYDRWVHFPTFPKPILLPTMAKTPRKRYSKDVIDAWLDKQKNG